MPHNGKQSFQSDMGAYLGKGTYWQFFHKLDSRENSLLNAANYFKIFLIGFEICLYEHFLNIRNPVFQIVAFISMFWQLKVNMFYPKTSQWSILKTKIDHYLILIQKSMAIKSIGDYFILHLLNITICCIRPLVTQPTIIV